jgi:LDH2 family malate/lactate/ureidoglycolate dehydrogenase
MAGAIPYPSDPAQEVRVPLDSLREFVIRVLVKRSVFLFVALSAADRMIEADLRGLASYGVRTLPAQVEVIDQGDIDPRGRVLVEQETPAVATLDGSRALGHVAATRAMEVAIKKAQSVGTGTVAVHHSQSLGAASVYAVLAAREGLIGFCTSNTGGATVAAAGSRGGVLANAPLAWAIPVGDGPPLVVDLATGASSWGKLQLLQQYGLPLPGGIAVDDAGEPAYEPAGARVMLPLAEGRGVGLALVAALLGGGLAGGKPPHEKTRASADGSEHLMMAIDIGHFTDRGKFFARAAATRQRLRESPSADPGRPVRAPGDRGWQEESRRREQGIPLHKSDAEALERLAAKLRLAPPWQPAS